MERENLRQAVDELRGEGTGTKLEIQGLRKMEKLIKVITLHVLRSTGQTTAATGQFRNFTSLFLI